VVAESLGKYFKDQANQRLIKNLQRAGVQIQPQAKTKQSLANKTYVLTGTLSTMTRDEAKEKIRQKGGAVTSGVSAKTTAVIAGDKPGSKVAKAQQLGVTILGEQQFIKLLAD
jgi:DNA ligase (NAD+)